MSFKTILCNMCACLVFISVNASATTLTFDSIETSGLRNSVTDSGFMISSSQAFWVNTHGASYCSPECPENGTNYLITQWEGGDDELSVSAIDGSLFNLTSFQYGEGHVGFRYAPQINVIGYLSGGGSVLASFILDGINDGSGAVDDFQTALLPSTFQNLSSVEFSVPIGYRYTLDNIAISSVPLPAAVWLFGSGLIGLIGIARRKKS
ncbi:MAG: VPLPA-CTERM sorting domain-containing protein [Gammaproteobacteria bacterium]|nr:VPLPA-CTERM sorting domain-containing protein [Gammaproteobacteria bacterium]